MAIRADDIDAFTEADRRNADRLEQTIDDVLEHNRSAVRNQKKISFTVNNDPDSPGKAVQQEIERRYQAAGWESVKFRHSYVDGYDSYWCLSVTLTRKIKKEEKQ